MQKGLSSREGFFFSIFYPKQIYGFCTSEPQRKLFSIIDWTLPQCPQQVYGKNLLPATALLLSINS
jgi:hypothetical protein